MEKFRNPYDPFMGSLENRLTVDIVLHAFEAIP
jgi:hypothetical protein